MEHSTVVDAPVEDVVAWHSRPGAAARLLPPWLPLRVIHEADSLESGTAVLALPLGVRWSATHRPAGYRPGEQFVDELTTPLLGRAIRWRHTHRFEPVSAVTTWVTDRVETRLPDRFVRQSLAYRGRQLEGDFAAQARAARLGEAPMTIAVTGSTGMIGSALSALLSTRGHRVVRLVRSPPGSSATARGAEDRYWDPASPAADLLDGVDAVAHLAGSPVFGRFSEAHTTAVRNSRIGPTRALAELVGTRPFVVASAVGIYGPTRGEEVLTESSARGDGFLADLVADWEAAADPARDSGSRVAHVRTGIVLSPRGGVLRLLRPVFSLGAGGRLGHGRQWTPWIGIDDIVDVFARALVDPALHGPVIATAPNPVRNGELTRTLARVLRRPALLPVPPFAARLALGRQLAEEFVLAGQRTRPAVLEAAGHRFRFPTLEPALRHLLGRVEIQPG